jgi:hypothetical protein
MTLARPSTVLPNAQPTSAICAPPRSPRSSRSSTSSSRVPVTRRSASSRLSEIVSGLGLKEAKDLVDGALQAAARDGRQGSCRGGQGQARGRRRDGHRQVVSVVRGHLGGLFVSTAIPPRRVSPPACRVYLPGRQANCPPVRRAPVRRRSRRTRSSRPAPAS